MLLERFPDHSGPSTGPQGFTLHVPSVPEILIPAWGLIPNRSPPTDPLRAVSSLQ